jgi:hypothetical protein
MKFGEDLPTKYGEHGAYYARLFKCEKCMEPAHNGFYWRHW